MASDWELIPTQWGDHIFVCDSSEMFVAIAPPGVALAASGADVAGWRRGLWDVTLDRFVCPLHSPPDEERTLSTADVLVHLPADQHHDVRVILEAQLALAVQFGVATQQRLTSGGRDAGSRTQAWLTKELLTNFGADAQQAIQAARYAAVPRERVRPAEDLSIRRALRHLLAVIKRRANRRLHQPLGSWRVAAPSADVACQETGEFATLS